MLDTIIQNSDHRGSSIGISQHGVLCSHLLGDYSWGKLWVERNYFVGLISRSIIKLCTQALCVTQEYVFSNCETWCYLQHKKVLFDSSGNPSWTSPDYNFYFALSIFFPHLAPHSYTPYIYIYTHTQQNCSVLVSWLMKDNFRKKLQVKIIWRSSGWHCWIIIISNKMCKS